MTLSERDRLNSLADMLTVLRVSQSDKSKPVIDLYTELKKR